MLKIIKYARSSELMNVIIKYGDEKFKFNLFEEAKITENQITREAIEQPSAYAFLALLHKKLIAKTADAETSCKRKFSELYVKYKSDISPSTGRPASDDLIREKVNINNEYIHLENRLNKLRLDTSIIEACVKTFEQRQFLIQTISANTRRENK